MSKLAKQGKGIILMHDFQKHTGEAPADAARAAEGGGLQGGGDEGRRRKLQTLPQYDEALLKDTRLPTVSSRPLSSVVQTISTN